jgi:hypothetical protein
MPAGRPPKGAGLVEKFEGSREAKRRFRLILETIHGDLPVIEAMARLNISESRFHQIRDKALEAGLASLEPGVTGRPPRVPPETALEMERMTEENEHLRHELEKSRVLAEVGMRFSHLPADMLLKKKPPSRKERRKKRNR